MWGSRLGEAGLGGESVRATNTHSAIPPRYVFASDALERGIPTVPRTINPRAVTSIVRALTNGPIRNGTLARYLMRVSSSPPRIRTRITSVPLDPPGFGVHGRLGKCLGPLLVV